MDRNGRRSKSLESDEELNGLSFEECRRLKRVENDEFKLDDKADEISLWYGKVEKSESGEKAKSESESESENLSDSESESKRDDASESDEEDDCKLKKKSRKRSKSRKEMRRRMKSRRSISNYDESEGSESQGSYSNSEDHLRSKKKKKQKSPRESKTKKESKTDRESSKSRKEKEVIGDESNVQALKLKGIFKAQKKPTLDNEPVRMNAIRIRKENQVYSAEDKQALAMFNYEENAKHEHKVMGDLQWLVKHHIEQDVDPT
ncbi:hypothetical protein PRUPE_6G167600 [Prunus persica]|uniref:NF-kappa-B-activating protein C-terminal domain-containing protein n=1 Tax=Prunus persica TaxID=3760 RepID=A0A251NRI4_PRUPE|nr:hypothetical protein PRUPE_6G167600 [Prunus persica]